MDTSQQLYSVRCNEFNYSNGLMDIDNTGNELRNMFKGLLHKLINPSTFI